MSKMSNEATKIINFMVLQLSSCKYGYRIIVEGCYDTAVENYSMPVPVETKKWIVDKVILMLNK